MRNSNIVALDGALATELCAVLRYRRHHAMARAMDAPTLSDAFLAASDTALVAVDRIATRIGELGEVASFDANGLREHAHLESASNESLIAMVNADIEAERAATTSLQEAIDAIVEDDDTRALLSLQLTATVENADRLVGLLVSLATPTWLCPARRST